MSSHRIYTSPYPDVHVPTNISVSSYLTQSNPDDVPPEKTILSDFDTSGRSISYGELRRDAARGAFWLKAAFGLKPGDVVCIYGTNSVSWVLLAHSTIWAGGYFSAINPLTTKYELPHYFGVSAPAVIAVDVELVSNVEFALEQMKLSKVPKVVVLSKLGNPARHSSFPQFPEDALSEATEAIAPYNLGGRDNRTVTAAMCFSSGTSGKPKGVLLSHHAIIAYLLTCRATNPFLYNAHIREVFFPPFAHIYGIISAVFAPSYVGSHVVAMPEFDFEKYLQGCARIQATILRLVPSTAIRLTKDPLAQALDLSAVQTIMCSGAALSAETTKDLQARLQPGAHVLNGYGMSELTITMLREAAAARKPGSVGKPAAGVAIRVVDAARNDVPPGADGECLVRGPTMFTGYKDNAAETAASFHDGWFCTGDVVRVDDDGYFYLTGRMKELIKVKGNQVAPAELEAVLLEHPLVADAGVCGLPDERDGEIPIGAVTLAESVSEKDRPDALREVRAFFDARVAPYKRLRGGLFHVDVLPKGVTGKLVRREILSTIDRARKLTPRL